MVVMEWSVSGSWMCEAFKSKLRPFDVIIIFSPFCWISLQHFVFCNILQLNEKYYFTVWKEASFSTEFRRKNHSQKKVRVRVSIFYQQNI